MRFSRFGVRASLLLAAAAAVIFLLNTNLLAPASGKPLLLAHRGLGQSFSREGLTGDTCTAERILPPEHPYLENTVASIQAAFDAGTDIVEFDIQPTTDGHFVVFHDWTLDCRTNGTGETRAHTLAELKALDIGYGYTADGGKTFPFRGKGIGRMPSLDEVLTAFPRKRFLINIKSDDPAEGDLLAETLDRSLQPGQIDRLAVYGGDLPIAALHRELPALRVLATGNVKPCLLTYFALGWSGYVPAACRGSLFMVPVDFAPWTWGFPGRLQARLRAADTMVVLLGPYDGSGFSTGIDTVEDFARVPSGYDGVIWTNRIDRIGPLAKARAGE